MHNNASQPPWQVSAGYAVLDASRPLTVLQRGDKPILEPEEAWERKGRVANSVLLSGLRRVDPPKADLPYWADQFVGYYSGAEVRNLGGNLGKFREIWPIFSDILAYLTDIFNR